MKIIADENILFAKEFFSQVGDLTLLPGRKITHDILKNIDILCVRSITKINQELLENTAVKFVGIACTGTDHVDIAYLKKKNIGVCDASGANANSVAEYVLTGLIHLHQQKKIDISKMTLGIIGVGHIGKQLMQKLACLENITILQNDPIKEKALSKTEANPYCNLTDLLKKSDVVTLHVPLTYAPENENPTFQLINQKNIIFMKKNAILINTSRGGVVEESALIQALKTNQIKGAIVDVWSGEPKINEELLKCVDIGTPHIAGYSFEGKINQTNLVYQEICQFFGIKPAKIEALNQLNQQNKINLSKEISLEKIQKIAQTYNIQKDDEALRKIETIPEQEKPHYFDNLRKTYPIRREYSI